MFALDTYGSPPVVMMDVVEGDSSDPSVEMEFVKAVEPEYKGKIEKMERFAFYERSRKAFAIVVTGEVRKYGNVIIKKGVTPVYK